MKTNINIFNNLNESLERELNNKRKFREIVKSRKEKKLIESAKLNKTKSNNKLTEATVIWDSEPTFDNEEDAEDYDYDLWLEDFNLNVLPDIKNQCRNDILVMAGTVGRWNKNFGGGTVIDVDDLLGIENVDSVRLISDNGNIVWEGSHHDGTHSMGLYTVPNDLEARKKIVYDLGIIDWLKDIYDYESEEYCVEDALDRLDSIGDLKDMLTPEDYAKVPEYFTPIKVTGNMPQIKESEELANKLESYLNESSINESENPIIKNPDFYWLDNDTFIMEFGYSRDDDGWYNYMVEYWLDDNSFHFLKVYEYDTIEADFSEEKKTELMNIMKEKIKEDLNIDIDGEEDLEDENQY